MKVILYVFKIIGLLGILWTSLASSVVMAESTQVAMVYGLRSGYLTEVAHEKDLIIEEMVLISKPGKPKRDLNKVIFTSKLKRELVRRYEYEFGYTDIERNLESPNRFDELEYNPGVRVTIEEDVERKQKYGEFLIKRLSEHHVDEYFKSSPTVRPIYEMKERISKLKVAVKKGYDIRIKYQYAGNYFRFKIDNPYDIRNEIVLQMDPESVGPGEIKETRLSLYYPVSKTVTVASHYRTEIGQWDLTSYKALSPRLGTSITGTTIGDEPGFYRVLVGISWRD